MHLALRSDRSAVNGHALLEAFRAAPTDLHLLRVAAGGLAGVMVEWCMLKRIATRVEPASGFSA